MYLSKSFEPILRTTQPPMEQSVEIVNVSIISDFELYTYLRQRLKGTRWMETMYIQSLELH